MTENLSEEDVSIDLDLDSIEERLLHLHENLDETKEMGRKLGTDLSRQAADADPEDQERVEYLARSAYLLTRRIEHGDRAVVRGR